MHNKAFNIAKNQDIMDVNAILLQWFVNVFIKTFGNGIKNQNISNQHPLDFVTRELAEELHKSIIRNFEEREAHSYFIDNIWGADLADMQFIDKCNKGFRFILCVIDIFSKNA